jgi:amino acid adenylation domain-containing protein
MVVGLLAILKAGSVYVPMDPDSPRARLAAVIADSRAVIVLGDGPSLAALDEARGDVDPAPFLLDVVGDLDGAAAWADQDDADLAREETGVTARHGAYVMYTSGSTGRPKGVLNEHRGILNRLRWMQESHPLGADDLFLQTAALAFGASVVEIFWPLLAGAPLLLTRPGGHKDPAHLAGLIRDRRVTALHFVPSMLRAFLDHPDAAGCRGLERVFCGGEAMPGALARRCRELLPETGLTHLFGSSETAVLTTQWDCAVGALPDHLPIGRPGANTRVHILDAGGEPVPRGVRGEIHIAGRQVARGYLDHARLDAERFVPDPYSEEPGARMYRTGDLGRQLADGTVQHLGRNDFQIKIRGQRVELGEIEAQLLAEEGVHQAVVLARDYGDGEPRLVAYLVAESALDPAARVGSLQRRLQSRLPSHMWPTAWQVMDAFPLNANGKLDRGALPLPEPGAPRKAGEDVTPPEDEIQEELLEIWRDLLKRSPLGIDDDFFAAGGHSLMVLRLGNRLREAWDIELDLKGFFAAPTVRALAASVDRIRQARRATARFEEFDAAEVVEF